MHNLPWVIQQLNMYANGSNMIHHFLCTTLWEFEHATYEHTFNDSRINKYQSVINIMSPSLYIFARLLMKCWKAKFELQMQIKHIRWWNIACSLSIIVIWNQKAWAKKTIRVKPLDITYNVMTKKMSNYFQYIKE